MPITAESVYRLAPYARTLGVTFDALEPGPLTTRLAFTHELSTTNGGLHGGAVMGLADVSAAVCAVLHAAPGSSPATTDSTAHFLRPLAGDAVAVATPLRIGRSQVVVEVQVRDAAGELCVHVVQTVAVRAAAGTA